MLVYLNQSYGKMLKDCRKESRQPDREMLVESVLHGAVMRLRPVVMTATAIVAGLLPIFFGTGTGSEVMSRIAAPMVGGMISAVVLTLLVLPGMYFLLRSYQISKIRL